VDQFNLSVLADPKVLDDAWQFVDRFDACLAQLEAAAGSAAHAA
jgi:hypothetical protein